MESDEEYPPQNSRQARASRRAERHSGGGYGRTDCFRVEKHLLIFGYLFGFFCCCCCLRNGLMCLKNCSRDFGCFCLGIIICFHFPPFVSSWGRWHDILAHARCKRRLGEKDVETICRVILVFCLLHYRGDENIKSFIWELITPPENGQEPNTLLNHSGMS